MLSDMDVLGLPVTGSKGKSHNKRSCKAFGYDFPSGAPTYSRLKT